MVVRDFFIRRFTALICIFSILLLAFASCRTSIEPPYDPDRPPEEPMHEELPPQEPMPGEPMPPEPMPGEPMPPEPMPEGQLSEPPSPPQEPPPPPNQPGQNPQPPGNQCQSNLQADVAITDLYPGNQPQGMIHIRITNKGPCTLQNVKDSVYCFVDQIDLNTKKASTNAATVSVTYNMASGVTQTFPTGISVDMNTFSYTVQCNLQPGGFIDPNHNNNSHTEKF